jgi:hypothetical protein
MALALVAAVFVSPRGPASPSPQPSPVAVASPAVGAASLEELRRAANAKADTARFDELWRAANAKADTARFDELWQAANAKAGTATAISLAKPLTFSATFRADADSPTSPVARPRLAGPAVSIVWTNPSVWSDRFGFVVFGDQLRLVLPDPTAVLSNVVLMASIPMRVSHMYRIEATARATSKTQMDVSWTLTDTGRWPGRSSAPVLVANGVAGGVPAIGTLDATPQYQGFSLLWSPLWSDAK